MAEVGQVRFQIEDIPEIAADPVGLFPAFLAQAGLPVRLVWVGREPARRGVPRPAQAVIEGAYLPTVPGWQFESFAATRAFLERMSSRE